MSEVRKDLKYLDTHEWVKLDGNIATIGISDYAQHSLGDIVYLELNQVGDKVSYKKSFAAIESVKAASDINSPVTGIVVEVNESLMDTPELINEDAYSAWLIKVEITDESSLSGLLNAEEYTTICK